jgi:hypothetical protein
MNHDHDTEEAPFMPSNELLDALEWLRHRGVVSTEGSAEQG